MAELSIGFPGPDDPYLGLLMLGSWAQNAGYGKAFLKHIEALARQTGATKLYLAVLADNPRGWSFWAREGFEDTGLSGENTVQGRPQKLHRLMKRI